jgi:hypothetical protein
VFASQTLKFNWGFAPNPKVFKIHKGIQFVSKSNQKNENSLIKNQSVHLDIGKGKRSKESGNQVKCLLRKR